MKKSRLLLFLILTALTGKCDIITLQWKGSQAAQKKFVSIPAGKVCRLITMSPNIQLGYVDAAGGEIIVFNSVGLRDNSNQLVIAGPAKLYFKKETTSGSIITLELVDQNTPKSGVSFSDN